MKSPISLRPRPVFRLEKINGRSPRLLRASRSITSGTAPTRTAKSIVLMTKKSERVIIGPPLRRILSPADAANRHARSHLLGRTAAVPRDDHDDCKSQTPSCKVPARSRAVARPANSRPPSRQRPPRLSPRREQVNAHARAERAEHPISSAGGIPTKHRSRQNAKPCNIAVAIKNPRQYKIMESPWPISRA